MKTDLSIPILFLYIREVMEEYLQVLMVVVSISLMEITYPAIQMRTDLHLMLYQVLQRVKVVSGSEPIMDFHSMMEPSDRSVI